MATTIKLYCTCRQEIGGELDEILEIQCDYCADLDSQEEQLPTCPCCGWVIDTDVNGIGFCACCKEFRAPYMEVAS